MTRPILILALTLAGGCAKRDVSPGMQRRATNAALQSQLDEAERAARPDGFWDGMEPIDGVYMAGEEPVIVEPEAPSDLTEPEPVSMDPADAMPDPEETTAEEVAAEVVATEDPVLPGDEPAEIQPQSDRDTSRMWSELEGPGWRTTGSGSSDLVRAIDDLRWNMTLEARLADKQRLIDDLAARVGGYSSSPQTGATAATDPALLRRLDAMGAQQQKLVDSLAARDEAHAQEAARVSAELQKIEERAAALTSRLDALEPAAASTAEPTESAETATSEPTGPSEPAGPSEEMLAILELKEQLAARPEAAAAPNNDQREVLMAVADLRAQVSALATAQQNAEARADNRERGFLGLFKKQSTETVAPTPTAPVAPVVVQNTAETDRLRQELAESEAARVSMQQSNVNEMNALEARLAAFEADGERMEALRAELAASGDDERLAQVEQAMKSLEADRAKLGSLQDQVKTLAEERTALEAELKQADETRRMELMTARAESDAQTTALNEELRTLRERQLAMEQKYTKRQEAVLARLQPLVDSGLQVRMVDGTIRVDLPSDVLFGSGSASLGSEGAKQVRSVATVLEPFPSLRVQVQGHTDNVPVGGSRFASNWDLAFSRANAVLQVLLTTGLPANRTSAASFGDTRPIADNTTPVGRERNRRIELALELPPLEETP